MRLVALALLVVGILLAPSSPLTAPAYAADGCTVQTLEFRGAQAQDGDYQTIGDDIERCENGQWEFYKKRQDGPPPCDDPEDLNKFWFDPNFNGPLRCQPSGNWVVTGPPDATPETQTAPQTSCNAQWTVWITQLADRAQTIRAEFGDGSFEEASVPAGSGTVSRSFAHTFAFLGSSQEHVQSFTVLQTGLTDYTYTLHEYRGGGVDGFSSKHLAPVAGL